MSRRANEALVTVEQAAGVLSPRDAERLRRRLAWSRREMAAFLAVTPGAYAYRVRKGTLRPAEGERLARLAHLLAEARRVLGGEEAGACWLTSPILSLGGVRPVDLLGRPGGYERVRNKLMQVEHGTF